MPVEIIKTKLENNSARNKIKINRQPSVSAKATQQADSVSFTGGFKSPNFIVSMMDFIAVGGYAAAFIIQDGLGFIAPRVGKGLLRGGKKKRDENGNEILDKKGNPKRELNWAYARKEGLREVITGPSAFVIPWLMLKGINKKFGAGNNIRLDYIDGFKNIFTDYANKNIDSIKTGKGNKQVFYEKVFNDVIEHSVNSHLPENERMTSKEISKIAKTYAEKQVKIDKIEDQYSGYFKRKVRQAEIEKQVGTTVEDDFMALKKKKIGGKVNEMAVEFKASNGKDIKHGSIKELTDAMKNYFDDAVKNTHEALKNNASKDVKEVISKFTNRRMGSRFLTNIGIFLTVAAFYTQIPKLYNMGTKGVNPALANEDDDQPALQKGNNAEVTKDSTNATEAAKNVSFGSGAVPFIEKTGEKVFNGKKSKYWSDIFELSGPVIQGNAMSILLYGFCIPPRLANAQDKYDYGEIVLRDLTAFTTLLFGAKALARGFSDGFTKLTGLALNSKNLEGRNWYQKTIDYLNPSDARHSVLSSKQLESKYTNLKGYKGEVNGFIEFIEKSGGDIKKAFAQDKNIKAVVEDIVKANGKESYAKATSEDIKAALSKANAKNTKHIKEFYKLFEKENGLLNRAKTCNSTFGCISTLAFVPGLIIGLTDLCKYMTDKRKAKEKAEAAAKEGAIPFQGQDIQRIASSKPTMEGFIKDAQ